MIPGNKNNILNHELTDVDSFVDAGLAVDVDVTDALAVAQHRDALSRPLNVSDQLGRAPRDDQVDHLVQFAEILHVFACAHLDGDRNDDPTELREHRWEGTRHKTEAHQLNGVGHAVNRERFLSELM